jgi:signal transduction histidine kinase
MLTSDQDLDASSSRQVITSPSLQYPTIVTELSIEQSKVMPIFSEATAMAIRLAKSPVAILMVTGKSGCQIGSISGLEKFTRLPSQPNLLLELAGLEYCYAQVMSSENRFSVTDCQRHPQLAQFPLFRVHGIQSYLGLPIVTAAKDRLGTIAILDFKPRQFSDRDIDLLQIVGRLVASEFERKLLSQSQLDRSISNLHYRSIPRFDDAVAAAEYGDSISSIAEIDEYAIELEPISLAPFSPAGAAKNNPSDQDGTSAIYPQIQGEIQFKLLTHLAQELRTPLTSILGMASVLQQEVYGALSGKQKDYLGIIHQSGQQLVTIVAEISQLGELDVAKDRRSHRQQLTLKSVDLEMLCQLALQSLEPLAQKKNQRLVLDITTGSSNPETLADRILSIDKDKVRQIVYYLSLSLIYASAADCQISIQIAHLVDRLQIRIATNDPLVVLQPLELDNDVESFDQSEIAGGASPVEKRNENQDRSYTPTPNIAQDLRISLGLSLSYKLAAAHGGSIELIASRLGYQFTLPRIDN